MIKIDHVEYFAVGFDKGDFAAIFRGCVCG